MRWHLLLLVPSIAFADPALRAQRRFAIGGGIEFVPTANIDDTKGGDAAGLTLRAVVNVVPAVALEADLGTFVFSWIAAAGVRVYLMPRSAPYLYVHGGAGHNSHVVLGTGDTEGWTRSFVAGGAGYELVLGKFAADLRAGVGASDGHPAPDLALTLGARF